MFYQVLTSIDYLGLPELGLNESDQQSPLGFRALGFEHIYLLDNHLALCTLLLVPRLLGSEVLAPTAVTETTDQTSTAEPATPALSFLAQIDPPLLEQLH